MKLDKQPTGQPELTSTTPSPANANLSNSLGRRAGFAVVWNIAFLPLKAVLSLFVALVIVKLFPDTTYAGLATVLALQATMGMFVDLGIERALPRFVGQIEKEHGRGALKTFLLRITLVKLAILSVLIVLLTAGADRLVELAKLGEQGRIYLALVAVLLVLGGLYDVCTQVLYSFFKQKVTNLLDIVVNVLYPLLTLGLIVWPWRLGIYGVMLALLVTTVISVLIATRQAWLASQEAAQIAQHERELLAISTSTTVSPSPARATQPATPAPQLWRRFVKYAGLMYYFNISAWFYDASFAIIVFQFFNAGLTVALIKLSYSFIKQLLKTLLAPLVGVQTPLFSSIHAEGRSDRLQAAYSSLSKIQIFLLVPSATGAMLLSRNLVELLFMSENPQAVVRADNLELTAWATVLTILFTFLESLISLPMSILQVYERYRLVLLARTLPLMVGGLLVLAAILNWNVIAAVCLMGVMAVGSRLIALLALRRTLNLRYPTAFLWKVLKASLAFGLPLALAVFLLPVNWLVTLAATGLGGVIFLVAFRGLGGFDPEDKARLLNLKLPLRQYIARWL